MNQHLPGRWSFEELLRAEKDKCASEFVPEQLELVGEGRLGKAQFSSSFFIVRRQFTIIIIIVISSSSILANFYYYSLLSSCFCRTFVLSNRLKTAFYLLRAL